MNETHGQTDRQTDEQTDRWTDSPHCHGQKFIQFTNIHCPIVHSSSSLRQTSDARSLLPSALAIRDPNWIARFGRVAPRCNPKWTAARRSRNFSPMPCGNVKSTWNGQVAFASTRSCRSRDQKSRAWAYYTGLFQYYEYKVLSSRRIFCLHRNYD